MVVGPPSVEAIELFNELCLWGMPVSVDYHFHISQILRSQYPQVEVIADKLTYVEKREAQMQYHTRPGSRAGPLAQAWWKVPINR